MKNLQDKIIKIDQMITGVEKNMAVLDENLFPIDDEYLRNLWETFAMPIKISENSGDCMERLDELQGVY